MELEASSEALLIETSGIIDAFIIRTKGVISQEDLVEIVTQIFERMMNVPLSDAHSAIITLPDVNRLVAERGLPDNLREATHRMAMEIIELCTTYFTEPNSYFRKDCFSFVFRKFVGNDMIIDRLPY